jgi:two-component system response regulator YesN
MTKASFTLRPVQVLICDDEADIRNLYRFAFEAEGAEVAEASNGDECLERLGVPGPDVVILDLFMPIRNGLSVLPELRQRLPKAAILFVSAHASVDVFDKGRALGATACFEKLAFLPRIPEMVARYSAA